MMNITERQRANELCKEVVGLSLLSAKAKFELAEIRWRIVSENGTARLCTADCKMDRVNLRLTEGMVTEAFVG